MVRMSIARPVLHPGQNTSSQATPAITAARIVGDHSVPRPAACAAFQRSITRRASSRAAFSSARVRQVASMSGRRVRTPMRHCIRAIALPKDAGRPPSCVTNISRVLNHPRSDGQHIFSPRLFRPIREKRQPAASFRKGITIMNTRKFILATATLAGLATAALVPTSASAFGHGGHGGFHGGHGGFHNGFGGHHFGFGHSYFGHNYGYGWHYPHYSYWNSYRWRPYYGYGYNSYRSYESAPSYGYNSYPVTSPAPAPSYAPPCGCQESAEYNAPPQPMPQQPPPPPRFRQGS
jgi:hypothetical protein